MKIAIGSTNPTKINAVKDVLGEDCQLISIDVPSLVSEQPFGDKETLEGAINRAKACIQENKEVSYAIGLEGGVVETDFGLLVINWGALVDQSGEEFVASGISAALPIEVASRVRAGQTLGEAIDTYTSRNGVSKKEGAMGIITNGRINRDEMFSHVVKSLIGQYEFYRGT